MKWEIPFLKNIYYDSCCDKNKGIFNYNLLTANMSPIIWEALGVSTFICEADDSYDDGDGDDNGSCFNDMSSDSRK